MRNEDIMKSSILTTDAGNGLLQPEQVKQFWTDAYDKTQLVSLITREFHRAKSGTLHKLFVPGRILKPKQEATAGTPQGVSYGEVTYQTKAVRLDWEISGEQLRENIEGASFEQTVANEFLKAISVDVEDLSLNGDEASADNFLKMNDGFIKQIELGGKVHDAGGEKLSLDVFYAAINKMENKYVTANLKWIMSPKVKRKWEAELYKANVANGGGYIESLSNAPAGQQIIIVDKMPEDKILLVDPKNLTIVNTYDMMVKKDATSKEAIQRDMVFYVVHFDIDFIVQHAPAALVLKNFA